MVYDPREDSDLLCGVVSASAFGRFLDMGTGSGVVAAAAKSNPAVDSVLAVDIDPEAVAAARSLGLDAVLSDLFSDVDGVFDTIACNTPYLPDEPLAPDVALDGGPRGFEWTLRFLDGAKEHLSRDGTIFLLISSLTNPGVIEGWLREHAFVFRIVARQRLSFEELFVYEIRWALPDIPSAEYLAHGKRSIVYRDGDRAIKVADPRRVSQESRALLRVNALGIGPACLGHDNDRLFMEFVPGERLDRFLASASVAKARSALKAVARQLWALEHLGVDKSEMRNPYKHIIVSPKGPVLIDWERARIGARTQNVRQFKEYLRRLPDRFSHLSSVDWDVLLDPSFADRVYSALRGVPAGKVITYGDLGSLVGCGSAQAVGQVLRRNPFAPFVPCHRVVAVDGSLHGFRGATEGPAMDDKRRLLADEGVVFDVSGHVVDGCFFMRSK